MADFLESYINGLDLSDLQAQADAQRQKQESERRQEAAKKNILLLPLSALREAPETMQCFRAADEERLQELTESIRHNGVLSLPIVRPMGAGTYEIIAGRNRCRAARALGYLELPCIVRDVNKLRIICCIVKKSCRVKRQRLTKNCSTGCDGKPDAREMMK